MAIDDYASVRATRRVGQRLVYSVDSTLAAATTEQLRAAPTTYPAWAELYIELPELPPRVLEFAARLAETGETARRPRTRRRILHAALSVRAGNGTVATGPGRDRLFPLRPAPWALHAHRLDNGRARQSHGRPRREWPWATPRVSLIQSPSATS